MLQRRLHDQIVALRETAFDLPNDAGLTQVLKLLGDAENEEKERIRERLQRSLPERRSIEIQPSTINEKIAMMMVPQPSKPGEPKPMYLSEEIAALCVQAACETDPHKLLELTTRINELFEEQDQIQQLADLNSGLDA